MLIAMLVLQGTDDIYSMFDASFPPFPLLCVCLNSRVAQTLPQALSAPDMHSNGRCAHTGLLDFLHVRHGCMLSTHYFAIDYIDDGSSPRPLEALRNILIVCLDH